MISGSRFEDRITILNTIDGKIYEVGLMSELAPQEILINGTQIALNFTQLMRKRVGLLRDSESITHSKAYRNREEKDGLYR